MQFPYFARRTAFFAWRQRRHYRLRLRDIACRLRQLLVQISKLRCGICPILCGKHVSPSAEVENVQEKAYRDQRALAKSVNPILVPQHTKELRVQARLEDLHIQRVVLICVNAKVFNLVERDALIFRC